MNAWSRPITQHNRNPSNPERATRGVSAIFERELEAMYEELKINNYYFFPGNFKWRENVIAVEPLRQVIFGFGFHIFLGGKHLCQSLSAKYLSSTCRPSFSCDRGFWGSQVIVLIYFHSPISANARFLTDLKESSTVLKKSSTVLKKKIAVRQLCHAYYLGPRW